MNSEPTTQLIKLLMYILIPIIIAVFGLIIFLIYIHFKERKSQEDKQNEGSKSVSINSNAQNKQSIFNFMEFDTVRDNMIIQKKGTRYLMVVECQGVNYDLMSGVEKTGVEEGFVQFLNTLRHPIQIYVQTRTVNLNSSIETYKRKLSEIEEKLNKKER